MKNIGNQMGVRSDLQLWKRAMQERWPIKEQYREAMIRRVMQIIADPDSTKREVATASRVLLAAEAQNQTDQRSDDAVDQRRNRFLDVAAGLGIATAVERLSENRSNSDPDTIDAESVTNKT
jgi:hypothetical protein